MWSNWRDLWDLAPRDEEVSSGDIEERERERLSLLEKRVSCVCIKLWALLAWVWSLLCVYLTLYNINSVKLFYLSRVWRVNLLYLCVCWICWVKLFLSGLKRAQEICVIVPLWKKHVVSGVILIVNVCQSTRLNMKFFCGKVTEPSSEREWSLVYSG